MSKYNIPVEYERYNHIVDNLVDEYTKLVEEELVTFESDDIMTLFTILGNTLNRLREVVDDMKEVLDSDKVALYTLMFGLVIEKSIMASDQLTEEQKAQVQSAFGENGFFQSLLGMFNSWFKGKLQEMDVNNDKKVTREEYVNYLFQQNKKSCPCVGDETNRRSAECSANCCFPFLSGGDGVINLEAEAEAEKVEPKQTEDEKTAE